MMPGSPNNSNLWLRNIFKKINTILTMDFSIRTCILIMVLWIIYMASLMIVGHYAHKAGYEEGLLNAPIFEEFTIIPVPEDYQFEDKTLRLTIKERSLLCGNG